MLSRKDSQQEHGRHTDEGINAQRGFENKHALYKR